MDLAFRLFDKIAVMMPGAIVENKRLGEALTYVQARQATYPISQQRGATGRAQPPNNLEAPGMPSRDGIRRSAISILQAK